MTDEPITQDVYFARTDQGKYTAFRTEAPYFCFVADTEEDVRQIAKRALNFYYSAQGGFVGERVPVEPVQTQISRSYRPKLEKLTVDSVHAAG